jgi:putative aldouronate transport system substrate-binding protein
MALTACSSEVKPKTSAPAADIKKEGYPIVNSPIELSIMMKNSGSDPWDNLWISKHLNELLGGTIKAIEVNDNAWNERKNLAFATNELPDMILTNNAFTHNEVTNYGRQGLIVPLNDLIEKYAPNIKAMLDANPSAKKTVTAMDGKIYTLPSMSTYQRELAPQKYWINTAWIEKLGLKVPKTLNDFYEVLKAFKEKDPNGNGIADEIPASGTILNNPIGTMILSALGMVEDRVGLDTSGKTVIYTPTQPAFMEYLKFMNKLYKEGLLDKEYFSQNIQQFRGKGAQQKVGFFFEAGPQAAVGTETYKQYATIPPLVSELNNTQMWPVNRFVNYGIHNVAITSKNKYPEASIRLIDYMYSKEGGFRVRIGPDKGEVKAGGGVIYNPDGTWTLDLPNGMTSPDWRNKYAVNINLPFYTKMMGPPNEQISELGAWITDNTMKNLIPFGKPVYPNVFLNTEEQDQINRIEADLDSYVDQMEAKFIVDGMTSAQWEEFQKTMSQIGVKKLVEIYQTAFDRWNR